MEVLENRVSELEQKHTTHKQLVHDTIENFRKWAAEASETDIYFDIEFYAKEVSSAREAYKSVWKRFKEAEAELEQYMELKES